MDPYNHIVNEDYGKGQIENIAIYNGILHVRRLMPRVPLSHLIYTSS
jgi:molybdenum cofactor biosynthesis enzyme